MDRIRRILAAPAVGPLLALLLTMAFFSLKSDRFLQGPNLSLVLQQVMVVGVLAIGQTMVILTAGIDLSCGTVMAFGQIVMTKLAIDSGYSPLTAILLGILACVAFGALNGGLVAGIRLPAFIVTLGTLNIAFALTHIYSNDLTYPPGTSGASTLPSALLFFGRTFTVGHTEITYGVVLMFVLFGLAWFALTQTAWGRHVYATGDDQEAARLRQRLAEARKRKQEIESAQRRNVELQSRYAALAADPQCQPPERLQLLRERRDCLQFLAVHSQQERGRLYARDLRAVEQRIAVEQAAQAAAAFAAAVSLDDQLLLARQTLAQFDALAEDESGLPDEIRELAAEWQHRLAEARTALAEHATRSAARARRRQRAILALAAIVLSGAFLAIGLLRGNPALAAANRLQNTDLGLLTTDGGAAVEQLRALAGDDRHAVRAVDLVAALGAATDLGAWQRDLAAELAADGVPAPFARQCWRIGVAQALRTANDAGRPALRAAVAEAAPKLAARDIRLAPDAQALLDAQR